MAPKSKKSKTSKKTAGTGKSLGQYADEFYEKIQDWVETRRRKPRSGAVRWWGPSSMSSAKPLTKASR